MTLYFLRHADKEKGRFDSPQLGHQDQPISRLGRRQAPRAAVYFRHKPLQAIFVSNYIRTLQTARPLAKRLRLQPVPDSRLNEIDLGQIETMTYEEVSVAYPDLLKSYEEGTADFRWPGGETGAEAQQRIVSFLTEQADIPGDKLVVTHDGIIRLLLCHLLGVPVCRRSFLKVETTGMMQIERQKGARDWTIVRFNQSTYI